MPTNLKLSKKQVTIVIGAAVALIIAVVLIFLGMRPPAATPAQATKLTVWGVEDAGTFNTLLSDYPYATVSYRQINPAHYNEQLLSALAAGTGPDVFEIGDRDLPKFSSIVVPFPTSTTAFGLLQLSQLFPDVVQQDFVSDGQIYGLPFSIDTLAMVYNKDLFNSAGIATPPKTWNEFDADITRLRKINAQGQIQVAGAAIGGSAASVPHAPDLLALLMLQNGTRMTASDHSAATFASQANGDPGLAALNFYLQFANASSPYYTWNDAMGSAFDRFASGKVAIIFAYQSDLAAIKSKAPFLNYGIAPMPQPKGATVSVNYPNYEGFVVAKSGQTAAAWNFVVYMAALSGEGQAYQAATGKPPALRAGIDAAANDPNLSVFAAQALTAKSWYEGDSTEADAALNGAITDVLTGAANPMRALQKAEATVSQLMR